MDVSGTTVGPVDETEKQLYQRAVAKLNSLASDRLDLRCATLCLASAASAPSLGDLQASKAGLSVFEKGARGVAKVPLLRSQTRSAPVLRRG